MNGLPEFAIQLGKLSFAIRLNDVNITLAEQALSELKSLLLSHVGYISPPTQQTVHWKSREDYLMDCYTAFGTWVENQDASTADTFGLSILLLENKLGLS